MATPPPNGKLQKCHNNNPPPIMMQTLIAFIPYPFLTYGAIPIPNIKMGTLIVTNCMFRMISFSEGIYENPNNSIINTEIVRTLVL